MKKIKIVTWNIGGGKILESNRDPSKLASYTQDGFEHITNLLAAENPDIITLQETHKNNQSDLVKSIADKLGYKFYIHDSTSPSHVDENFRLGHAIISKYPISNHSFSLFENPRLEAVWEDGSIAKSFDKGYSTVSIDIDDSTQVRVTTTHLTPFRRFNLEISSDKAQEIIHNVDKSIIRESSPWIVPGDFNIDANTIADNFPTAFEGMEEIEIKYPTNPKGRNLDHILFDGFKLVEYRVDNRVLTDHYPVIAIFEI